MFDDAPEDDESVEDKIDDLIADYDEMGDEFAGDRVETICDMVVDDLENLKDELGDGIFEPAAPGDPTIVEKPERPTKADAVRANIGIQVAAFATDLIYGQSVVALDQESGDLIVAVSQEDVVAHAEGDVDDRDHDYDNRRFGPPK